ncbi:uncharacterized protein MICPUCDRAFT_70802 [Micromonas pusilla CCMP1545]|uniref:Predicted protein n=1 Tax=Micromonas pusilla (strain CCMP1545) TaxID=564608 RepID=C1MKE1_MICPC|nr:uncharacterized protein MICPUCDRAFT_70802 [Micromonas pusilla CCMP1545]EEH59745.1 predicted protein [Micromonas pusilla CCMP1545]|eukprot:XP_003056369.1 predicted protein [Micromonas pusilla CCMP1545]
MSIAMVSSLHIPINRPRGFMFSRNTDMSASHLRAAETLKKKRVDSGSFCCSYRAYFPTKPLKKRIRAQMCMISSLSPSTSGPQPDVEEEGSALDFPEEYVRAVPSRRPDIFPDMKEPKQPVPKPMPGDPELPDEEEEEAERKKKTGEPGTDPEEEEEQSPAPQKQEEVE